MPQPDATISLSVQWPGHHCLCAEPTNAVMKEVPEACKHSTGSSGASSRGRCNIAPTWVVRRAKAFVGLRLLRGIHEPIVELAATEHPWVLFLEVCVIGFALFGPLYTNLLAACKWEQGGVWTALACVALLDRLRPLKWNAMHGGRQLTFWQVEDMANPGK